MHPRWKKTVSINIYRNELQTMLCTFAVSESDPASSLTSAVPAKVKLQISYNSSDQLLSVMVRHVRNLVSEPTVF